MRTVLIVDDDPGVCAILEALVATIGCAARSARSPRDALALVGREPIALAIIDVNLGIESGLALSRRLHDAEPMLPVILFSAASEVDPATTRAAGARTFVPKSRGPAALLAAIAESVGG